MEILAYSNYEKRQNSTKHPDKSDGIAIDGSLKGPTDLLHPTLIMRNWKRSYNYLYFLNRWYFVDSAKYINKTDFEISCSVDVLATYKTEIGDYSTYISRNANTYEAYIPDSAVSQIAKEVNVNSTSVPFLDQSKFLLGSGCYLLRVVGTQEASSGILGVPMTGITTYLIPDYGMAHVLNFMFSDDTYGDILSDEAVKTFFNPFQYIVDLKWIPLDYSILASGKKSLKLAFGWWTDDNTYPILELTDRLYWTQTIAAPTSIYNDFRWTSAAFTSYTLYIPTIGNVDIAPADIANSNSIQLGCEFDVTTGDAIIHLIVDNDIIATYNTNIAVNMQIGQIATDWVSVAGKGISAVGGVVGGVISKSFMDVASGVVNVLEAAQEAMQPTPSLNGSQANMSLLASNPDMVLTIRQYGSGEIPAGSCGRPLCQKKEIKELSGFTVCGNASINKIPGYSEERNLVNSYLNGGFYYE